MAVQDDTREQELCNLFNLIWDPEHARGGDDAWFEVRVNRKVIKVPVEVKSTTSDSVSTARDVGMEHISRWRSKIWVIGYYERSRGNRPLLVGSLCLTPDEMQPWIDRLAGYIEPDFQIGLRLSRKLTMEDLHVICGERDYYTVEDAQRLYKKQWSTEEYRSAMNLPEGYSAERMLEILWQRASYLLARGATLNNPHINKVFLDQFKDQMITNEHAARIREKFIAYYRKTI